MGVVQKGRPKNDGGMQLQKIVKRAQSGDKDAFVELISTYKIDMYRVAKGFFKNDCDAADAISATILACYEHLRELREPKYFKTWLIRILINKCNELIRSSSHYVGLEEALELSAEDSAQANAEFMMVMDTLGEQYRIIFILYYAEGMKVREISKLTGLSESAVKARLKRGREKAKQFYSMRELSAQKLEVYP